MENLEKLRKELINMINSKIDEINKQAKESELFEALKKEAIKRGFKEGVIFLTPSDKRKYIAKGNILAWNSTSTFGLTFSGSEGLILDNGVWAEIIKENTLDDVCTKLYNFSGLIDLNPGNYKKYLIENKLTLIKILNEI